MTKTVVLCILDGWGHREDGPDNAIAHASTPYWDALMKNSSHTLLEASELNVGLPKGQMGNSEVGHMNIGAGRVILQDLPRIDESIANHTLEELPLLKDFIKTLKKSGGTCHLLGLLSPGGIHSHEGHIKTLAAILADQGIPIALHMFLDGRDTPPKSAETYLSSLLEFIKKHPLITLATIGGRYYGMDRDKRWDRIQKAYEAMVEGKPQTRDALSYLQQSYAKNITDEFVLPVAIGSYTGMKDGDGLLMANFRSDRARQILTALLDPDFQGFVRGGKFSLWEFLWAVWDGLGDIPTEDHRHLHDLSPKIYFSAVLGLTEYSETLNTWMKTLFPPVSPHEVLGEVIAQHKLKQLRLAETEKYAHVTFFFNGGREKVFPGEDRILIPSPQVTTYDLKPEMSAFELTDRLVEAIKSKQYALIVVNYANTDMVGHTGDFEAARKAVEAVDACLGRIKEAVEHTAACLLITADHGNAEMMYDEILKSPHTAHTLNPVPFLIFQGPQIKLHSGKLSDIAPTILQILNIPKPSSMTGCSLLESNCG